MNQPYRIINECLRLTQQHHGQGVELLSAEAGMIRIKNVLLKDAVVSGIRNAEQLCLDSFEKLLIELRTWHYNPEHDTSGIHNCIKDILAVLSPSCEQ